MKRSIQQGLAICGIIAPILFTIVLITLGFLQPGYNHFTQYMSEFGAIDAPYAYIMNTVGIPLLGLLIIAFAFALNKGINNGNGSKIGPLLLVVSGVSLFSCGIFRCDPGCIPISTIGFLHSYVCSIALFSLIFAPFFMLHRLASDDRWHNYQYYSLTIGIVALCHRLASDDRWHNYQYYSLTIGIVALCLGVLFKLSSFGDLVGLFQRIIFGVPLLWVEIMAIKLFTIFNKDAIK